MLYLVNDGGWLTLGSQFAKLCLLIVWLLYLYDVDGVKLHSHCLLDTDGPFLLSRRDVDG